MPQAEGSVGGHVAQTGAPAAALVPPPEPSGGARPRIGLMLHADSGHEQNQRQQIDALFDTIVQAERVGLDTVWLTEQHHQTHSPTPRPELLIAHAAARTTRIEFGTAALTFGQRSPLEIAEIASSLALLAPRRLRLGVARGKTAPPQPSAAADADPLGEPIDALADWLRGETCCGRGEAPARKLAPTPPPRDELPVYLATRQASRAARAAAHGFGLMIGQFWPSTAIDTLLAAYGQHSDSPPALMLSRGYCPRPNTPSTNAQIYAHIEAVRQRKPLPQNMPRGQRPIDRVTPESLTDFVLLGDESEQIERLRQLAAQGVTDLALNLMTDDPGEQADWLAALGALKSRWAVEAAC
ncbi:LLM class flavin-dependent oxidoreductase [Halothiobacillus sp. DCM-1]|uniref:LLM class flavin-dependent oxidoreductase n=1 Tax=Halothiobacillus sp. DCM-1 TaxID=3112558 RepID=UPI00325158A1